MKISVTLLLMTWVITGTIQAGTLQYSPGTGSNLTIEGQGQPFNYACKTETIHGYARIFSDSILTGHNNYNSVELFITVPVRSFNCGISRLTRDFRTTLKADQYEYITFRLIRVRKTDQQKSTDQSLFIHAHGILTVAGEQKSIDLEVDVQETSSGKWNITASRKLQMSDFELTPPQALWGWVYAEDELTIAFDLYPAVQ